MKATTALGRRLLVAVAALLALWLLIGLAGSVVRTARGTGDPAVAPPSVTVGKGDVVQTVRAAGVLLPRVKVDVGAQVGGQVQQVHVQLGQAVRRGDLLVTLDASLAQSDLAQAQSQLAQQASALEVLQLDLAYAARELERQRRLQSEQATTGAELDRAQADHARLQAQLRGQQAVQQRLQAEVDKKQLALQHTRIVSPANGLVVALPVQPGQTLNAQQTAPVVATVADVDTLTVRARVPEADIAAVRVGQRVRVGTLSAPLGGAEPATPAAVMATVATVLPLPERLGNAVFFNVLFDLPNPGRRLFAEMTVQVDIETGRAQQVPVLPLMALAERLPDGQHEVTVLEPSGAAAPRRVRLGLRDAANVQVLEGLAPGERVLLLPPATPR